MICPKSTLHGSWSHDGGSYHATCACHDAVTLTWEVYEGECLWRAGLGPKPIHWRAP